MEKRNSERIDDLPTVETPEDVAVLYSWANLHGAKYRDFSASRREYRAQLRHRAAEQAREHELRAQTSAETAASLAEKAARQAEVVAMSHMLQKMTSLSSRHAKWPRRRVASPRLSVSKQPGAPRRQPSPKLLPVAKSARSQKQALQPGDRPRNTRSRKHDGASPTAEVLNRRWKSFRKRFPERLPIHIHHNPMRSPRQAASVSTPDFPANRRPDSYRVSPEPVPAQPRYTSPAASRDGPERDRLRDIASAAGLTTRASACSSATGISS